MSLASADAPVEFNLASDGVLSPDVMVTSSPIMALRIFDGSQPSFPSAFTYHISAKINVQESSYYHVSFITHNSLANRYLWIFDGSQPSLPSAFTYHISAQNNRYCPKSYHPSSPPPPPPPPPPFAHSLYLTVRLLTSVRVVNDTDHLSLIDIQLVH